MESAGVFRGIFRRNEIVCQCSVDEMTPALRFKGSDLRLYAARYDYGLDDQPIKTLIPNVRRKKFLSKSELRTVAAWKSPRSAGHMESNQASYVKEVTSVALAATSERVRIETLTILDGVSWPTASVILHFFHRGRYPIIDFRALWSVKLKPPSQYGFEYWWLYVQYCRQLASANHVDMRTLDRALWQYSKERQPSQLKSNR